MKDPIRQCALLLVAFTVWAEPALARNYLNCVSKKVIIVDTPSGSSSLSAEENIGFWIDEAAKIITLSDGTPLIVRRFDDQWISAARGDVSYEIDRQNGHFDIRKLDHERWHSDDHHRVGPVQARGTSGGLRVTPVDAEFGRGGASAAIRRVL
jgi:hypothetical protein